MERKASLSKEDVLDLRRAMERFDDKLDANSKGQFEIKNELVQLKADLRLLDETGKHHRQEVLGKLELAKEEMKNKAIVESSSTKIAIGGLKTREVIMWSVIVGVVILGLDILKDFLHSLYAK